MSYEGRVTPSDVMQKSCLFAGLTLTLSDKDGRHKSDITPQKVTPGAGKGALGKWRAPDRKH
ncbi:MAG: hypothetical protein J3T61_09295, partial [Candidatus Brocadiales bacterium]|nr:hypothetical protein [Candidatus Bathyanammoxibius sp.]